MDDFQKREYTQKTPKNLPSRVDLERSATVLPLPKGVNFFDVDWKYFFWEVMRHSYDESKPLSEHEKGRIDFFKLLYSEESGLSIEKILTGIKGGDKAENLFIAISASEEEISLDDRIKIGNALAERCQKLLRIGNIVQMFEIIEHLFPLFIDSFQIIKERLPKIIQPEFLFKTPECITLSEEENRKHFQEQGFEGVELEELTQQMINYNQLVFYWRTIMEQNSFRLKNREVLRLQKQTEDDVRKCLP